MDATTAEADRIAAALDFNAINLAELALTRYLDYLHDECGEHDAVLAQHIERAERAHAAFMAALGPAFTPSPSFRKTQPTGEK